MLLVTFSFFCVSLFMVYWFASASKPLPKSLLDEWANFLWWVVSLNFRQGWSSYISHVVFLFGLLFSISYRLIGLKEISTFPLDSQIFMAFNCWVWVLIAEHILSKFAHSRLTRWTTSFLLGLGIWHELYIHVAWFTEDLQTWANIFILLLPYKRIRFKHILIISLVIMVCDYYMVIISKSLVKEAQQELAIPRTHGDFLVLPQTLRWHAKWHAALGIGDAIFSGLIMLAAFRESHKHHLRFLPGLTFIGFVLGCLVMHLFFPDSILPATLFLLPPMILMFGLGVGSWSLLREIYKS